MDELQRLSQKEFLQASKHPIVFVLDNIRSLNNVGSIFRTADSFGLLEIHLCGLTGQPPHRDIQKTALGATESVKWTYHSNIESCLQLLVDEGFMIVGIEQTAQSTPLQDFRIMRERKMALILGNEISGVSEEALRFADTVVEIPQFGTKHSLNVSVTAGIVVWEIVGQFLKNTPKD